MATNVQVYQEPGGARWGARVVGDQETEPRFFGSPEEAVAEGRRLASERGVELVVHDEQGQTEEKGRPA